MYKKGVKASFCFFATELRNILCTFVPKFRKTMAIQDAIFRRSELLLGEEAMGRIAQKRVIIFGVGGVGSWCAESLVRSGIRQLTIVDSDRVCITNINRQLMATTKTVGQVKVEALKERLLSINPSAEVIALQKIFTQETAEEFNLDNYDYIIDAIDSLKDKAALILLASKTKAQLYSSMGAALKLDPTRIKVTEFWKVEGDPLARALRKKFKHYGQFPEKKFQVVYSDELLENRGCPAEDGEEPSPFNKPQTNGSLAHITAIFGFTLAGLVIQDIVLTADCTDYTDKKQQRI
jgi:tRNA A37 threonylcarbamoyladenosine dehydratase